MIKIDHNSRAHNGKNCLGGFNKLKKLKYLIKELELVWAKEKIIFGGWIIILVPPGFCILKNPAEIDVLLQGKIRGE